MIVAMTCGCGSTPSTEAGTFAYDGAVVNPATRVGPLSLGGSKKINPDTGRFNPGPQPKRKVFVRPADIAIMTSASNVEVNTIELAQQVDSAIRHAITAFDRFTVVDDERQADIAVRAVVTRASAWGDWVRSQQELQTMYKGAFFRQLSAEEAIDISREGITTLLTLEVYRTGSSELLMSQTVIGQVAGTWGTIWQQATGAHGSIVARSESRTAQVDNSSLPGLYRIAIQGAFVMAMPRIEREFWQ
ncbi:MAG TPA: hypothetical protein PKC43_04350 [Phycisphaerales bacterium]|nr:hypothetical protein [Phycisphaerales bacterium]HMP36659.1 hypothetical protein [Phycisphaerales bacterium]